MSELSITFHGAALRVTGSCSLLRLGQTKVLVDCGMIQGEDDSEEQNREGFKFKPSELDAVILTHGHLDHTGRVPLLAAAGFRGPIYTHAASGELAQIVWNDSARLSSQDEEGPLYSQEQVEAAAQLIQPLSYGEEVAVGEARFSLHDAGHILGSAHVLFESQGKRVLLSGDIGVKDTPIIRDPTSTWDQPVDAVVIESTYGDRAHRSREETLREFVAILKEAQKRKGVVIIPAFAIGRTQELLFQFNHLVDSGKLPRVPVLLDSPMAERVTELYRAHKECYDQETWNMIQQGEMPMTFPGLREIASAEESKKIKDLPPPAIIIAGSGMCTGGRVMHHLRTFLDKESTTVIFVGYQGNGTLGRRLVDGEKQVKIHGQEIEVKARIATLNGFSAHADQEGLLEWARCIPKAPSTWIVNHGEEASARGLAQTLIKAGYQNAQVAELDRTYAL